MDKNKMRFTPTPNEDEHRNRRKQSIVIWRGGFTLWEILLVVGLMVILFSFGLIASMDFYRQKILGAERDMLVAVLKRARSEAQNNVNQSSHGVYLGLQSNYVIFQGNNYASRNTDFDELFSRSGGIELSGPAELTFSSLDASSNVSGTIYISNGTQTSTISVNSEGRIDW